MKKTKAKKMMTAWVWICLATLAWLAMAEEPCWDSGGALHDPLTLLSDSEPLVGNHSGGGFLPVPVWKFLKVSDAADMSDLGRPQFRCSNRSLYLRFMQDRHSDLRLQDGRRLLLLLDRCHGSVWTFGPWLLLELPFASCPMALKISNGTLFRQMTVSYFDYLQQANVMAVISCEHPTLSQCVATPAVSCRSTKIIVKLPLGGRLHRVKALGKHVVLKRILTTTSGAMFVQISTQSDTDSIFEMIYLDSAGEMSTVLAACRVKQSKQDRHPRTLWDSNIAANYPYSTELSQPIETRDETEILKTRESLCDEDNAVTVGTTLRQVAYSDSETIKIPDGPSCAEEQDDLPCCGPSDDLPCCDPLDDLPCCTSSEEAFPCSEHSHKHPPSSQPPSRFPHGPLQGLSSSMYSSHSEPISSSNQSTLNGGQPISEGNLTVPHGTFSEGSSKSTSTSDQQAHSRVHSVWHQGQLVEIPSKDNESHSVSQTSVLGSQIVQQTSSESLDELLSRPGGQPIWGQSSGLITSGGCRGGPPGAQSSPVGSSQQSLPSGEVLCTNGPPGSQPSSAEQPPSVSLQMPFLGGVVHITSASQPTSNLKGHPLKGEDLPSETGKGSREEHPSKFEGGRDRSRVGGPSKGGKGGREEGGHEGRPSKGGEGSGEGRPSKGGEGDREGYSKGGNGGHKGSSEGRPSKGVEGSGHLATLTKLLGNQQISSHRGHPSKGVEGTGEGRPSKDYESYSSVIQATLFDHQRGHLPSLESPHGFFSSGGSKPTLGDSQQIRQTSLGGQHISSIGSRLTKGGEGRLTKGGEGSGEGRLTKGGEGRGHLVATLTKLLGNQQISSHGGHPSKGVEGTGEGRPSKDYESYSSVIQATLFDHQRGHLPSLESPHGFFSSGGSQPTLGDSQQIRQTSLGGHPMSVQAGKEVHSKGREGGLEGHPSKGGESRLSSHRKGSGDSNSHEGRHEDRPSSHQEGGRGGRHKDHPSSHHEGGRRGHSSSGRDDGGRQDRPSKGKDNAGRHS